MPGKKKSAKKKAVKKSAKKKAVRRMGGGMMGPKKKMARGGAMKKRGGGMMEKMMGGGMMGPKKKMAKGGYAEKMKKALERAKARKPSGRINLDDLKRSMPTGRSAAAKKAAMKGVKSGRGSRLKSIMASINKGKGNPAGKDLSMRGALRRSGASLLAKLKKARRKKK
mgnify:FL=1